MTTGLESFRDDMTLGEARALLRSKVVDGANCPCCRQKAKVYKRKINSTMARALIQASRQSVYGEFFHAPSLPGDTHEFSQLAWWNLAVEEPSARPDGGRSGWWALTELGWHFVLGRTSVKKYAHIYDGRVIEKSLPWVGVRDCLGSKFNYDELMRGE